MDEIRMGRKSPLNQNLVKTPNGGLNDWGTQSDSVSEVTLYHAKLALIGRIYGAVQSIARSVGGEVGEIFVAKEVNRKARYTGVGCRHVVLQSLMGEEWDWRQKPSTWLYYT